ncbi:MAG: hypothetical protein AAF826_04475 [Pseudomonadota bacterium]
MNTLLVDFVGHRLSLWSRHLERCGLDVTTAETADAAMEKLTLMRFDTMVINMGLPGGTALSVSDYAIFKNPDIRIVAVSSDKFFSDGTLFKFIPNLRSHLADSVHVEDMSATVAHYAAH